MLLEHSALHGPDFSRPFVLATDASDSGAGAVLMQEHDQNLCPVAYFSRKFTGAQLNYSTIEKECLAILWALSHFEIYLSALHSVTILCDHNPLKYLMSIKFKNARLMRWSVEIGRFNPVVKHIPGSQNVLADVLSRA